MLPTVIESLRADWQNAQDAAEEELLSRLVALNAERAAEALARRYTGARAARVAEVLDTLVALG